MVSFGEFEKKNSFGDDKITQNTFLSSLNSWYKDGVKIGVERCSPFNHKGRYSDKVGFAINCSILDGMDKCRARVIGEDGKAETMEDQLGNTVEKVEIIEDEIDRVTLFISFLSVNDDGSIHITKNSASSKVIFPVMVASGLIPEDVSFDYIDFTSDEFVEACESYECLCKASKNKNGRLVPEFVNIL